MSDLPTFTGRCYCGDVHYSVTAEPLWKAQCHCRECQYITGGGPNYFLLMPAASLIWTKGTPAHFARSDLESPRVRRFCGTCGTHLTTELPDGERVVVKVGTLDDPTLYGGPKAAIYTVDQQPFHLIDNDIPAFERLP